MAVDADDLSRQGMKSVLAPHADINVVGEGATGERLPQLMAELRPDILLIDLNVRHHQGTASHMSTQAGLKELLKAYPETAVILISWQFIPIVTE